MPVPAAYALVFLFFVTNDAPLKRSDYRTFPTYALCEVERQHFAQQIAAGGTLGHVLCWCEPR